MKKAKKILVLLLCAVLLVGASIAGTVAYLTDTDNVVENTFTVGKVVIDLDEAKVNKYGELDTTATSRVDENEYLLVPGRHYVKDPTVHVKNDSEPCYVFVKVDNNIAGIESDPTIASQILANGWTVLQDGVYYKTWNGPADASKEYTDLLVFSSFDIAKTVTAGDLEDYDEDITVTVTAYAIQLSGFEGKPADAWAAVSAAATPTPSPSPNP